MMSVSNCYYIFTVRFSYSMDETFPHSSIDTVLDILRCSAYFEESPRSPRLRATSSKQRLSHRMCME